MNATKTIADYIKESTPITIKLTTERGYAEYAICLTADLDYWINSFSTLEKAKKYCERLNLPITEINE